MKTSVKRLFLLAFLFFVPNLVNAASSCSYSEQVEINEIVSHVNATYEVVEEYVGKTYDVDNANEDGTYPEVDSYAKAFDIHILNITEDIYVKVTNNYNSEEKIFRYNDTDNGVATFRTNDMFQLVTYTIEVYANKYACAGELFQKYSLTTPVYNIYSHDAACRENPDFYYCQEFIPSENITANEFRTKIRELTAQKAEEQREQEENKSFMDKIREFYKDNAIVINSIGVAIVVMGVVATVILVKKKRSRVL